MCVHILWLLSLASAYIMEMRDETGKDRKKVVFLNMNNRNNIFIFIYIYIYIYILKNGVVIL